MLDIETRRRIDTARDILVGKVPDPKSQVEQITIALIYKFMDDMDAGSEEIGGKRKFFADEFERYGWARLMAPGLGGHEMLNLYAEAITRMPENPGIPPLFRDIFKNAYLPYRDPETLKAFLKIIDDFSYDHSERLGDAFEYLLSVLGSQGDAGQFRTPRHIIDFMVAVVDPRKDERILDPACGTAGFLISAWKHIMAANSAGGRPGAALSPDEQARLMDNVRGYDISPDMVRLSLVNLYLHGFIDPHVEEYDTLTSEDRWNEYYNVILANPPFMSPKGGIRPHKRFSVQSNRSEVLFVDYIAEHLSPGGRAAVIVPEGVIFQSGNAYKQLRKLLVEEYLAGVISLPAGVFNPYSGVKTSILWLDKTIAKQTDSVLFVKIEADGFDLGAQRKEIKRNDLPEALEGIIAYKASINGNEGTFVEDLTGFTIVTRESIAKDGDYSLSGERYKSRDLVTTVYPPVKLSDVCTIVVGGTPSRGNSAYWENGNIKWISSKYINDSRRITGYEKITQLALDSSSSVIAPKDSTIVISRVSVGKIAFADDDYAINQDLSALITKDTKKLDPKYLFLCARKIGDIVAENAQGIGVRGVTQKFLGSLQIPLPPLSIQEAIVAEVESYQRIIDGARQVVENWRPRIEVDAEWPVVKLGEVCEITMGQSPPGTTYNKDGNGVPLINGPLEFGPEPFSRTIINQYTTAPTKMCKEGDLILCVRGSTTGRMNIAGYSGCIGRGVASIRSTDSQQWINYVINVLRDRIYELGVGSTFPNISSKELAELPIPLPPQELRRSIICDLEKEQRLVDANRNLIALYERKIKDRIARVWGE